MVTKFGKIGFELRELRGREKEKRINKTRGEERWIGHERNKKEKNHKLKTEREKEREGGREKRNKVQNREKVMRQKIACKIDITEGEGFTIKIHPEKRKIGLKRGEKKKAMFICWKEQQLVKSVSEESFYTGIANCYERFKTEWKLKGGGGEGR